jgi:predicted transcriptional regulator
VSQFGPAPTPLVRGRGQAQKGILPTRPDVDPPGTIDVVKMNGVGRGRPHPASSSEWYAGIPMQRTTVKLSDDLDARLRHEAQRRGTTIAEITRTALEAHLGATGSRRRLGAAAAGRSGRSDISERAEEIIRAESASSR